MQNMVIFHSYVTNYQRVNLYFPMVFLWFSYDFPMFLWVFPWFLGAKSTKKSPVSISDFRPEGRTECHMHPLPAKPNKLGVSIAQKSKWTLKISDLFMENPNQTWIKWIVK